MADEISIDQITGKLSDDEKKVFETHLKTASETAVTEFKTKTEAERKKAIPEKYDVKFGENSLFDPAQDTEEIVAYLKATGSSTEQAAKFIEKLEGITAKVHARQLQTSINGLTELRNQFKEQTRLDKSIGGANLAATALNVNRFMDAFAPAESEHGKAIRALLAEFPHFDHPAFQKAMSEFGKAIGPDTQRFTGQPPKKKLTDAEIVYGVNK